MGKLGLCCCSCIIHSDSFDRADAAVLGGSWCEKPGDWEIFSNTAKLTLANKYAILDVPHPAPSGTMVVSFDTVNESIESGDKYRIMLNVVKTTTGSPPYCTTNSFYFADFIRNGTNDSIIKLGICSGGTEVIIKEDVVLGLTGTTRKFTAILGEREFCAFVSNATLSLVATNNSGHFSNGYYCGMAGTTAGLRFDNFTFEHHYTTNKSCLFCLCECDTTPIPPVLNVKIYPDPSSCTRLNKLSPCEFTLEWDRVNGRWKGEKTCCSGGQLWRLELACPTGTCVDTDANHIGLSILVGCTASCGGCGSIINIPTSATCSPFKLVYGPFLVAGSDFTCTACSTATPTPFPPDFGWGSCYFYIEVSA